MIKQYDFPKIFHNIVGEVIPITLKNRQSQTKYLNLGSQQVEGSNSRFCLKDQETIKGKLTLKSKKKEIVRRMKFNKTLGSFSLRKYRSQEDKSSQNDNQSQMKNFLKKKQFRVQKTQRTQRFDQNIQRNADYQQSMKNDDQVSSNIARLQPKNTSKRHMSSIRLRTSIDQYSKYEMDKAIEEIIRNPNKRTSQINPNLCIKESLPTRSKIKHKTFFNFDIDKDDKMQIEKGQRINSDRKRIKKKTVNFTVLQDEKENSDTKNLGRKGSKMTTLQRQAKINQNSKKPTSKHLSKTSLLNQSSQWSAKTVVSIKFDSNYRINSKKSLRSQQSILLNSNNNFTIKKTKSNNRYGTKTFLKFTQRGDINFKKYKSMKSISQISIDIKSQKSMKQSKVKNKANNKTLVTTSSNVKKILKAQNQHKAASILVKTAQPYLITDSVKSIQHKSTFQDLIFKKSTKGLFKAIRPNTEPDIFTELNNFHQYLNENEAQDNDQDLQRGLTKPMVLNSQTLNRISLDPQIQRQQNFIIDMGLNLIKKMSILKQKRF